VKAPELIKTPRLILRKPDLTDAQMIFTRYAGDLEVTRLLGWPRHESLDASRAFLAFSNTEWERWPAGPYLVESREDGTLLGSTGLAFETPYRASTGYVLAKDAWGKGYATEVLQAVVGIANKVGIIRLYALCHFENPVSCRVLEKCGFACEGILRRHSEFPYLKRGDLLDVFCYAKILE
jgi:ribosomal-protein-alanine N-acetyltransferase